MHLACQQLQPTGPVLVRVAGKQALLHLLFPDRTVRPTVAWRGMSDETI